MVIVGPRQETNSAAIGLHFHNSQPREGGEGSFGVEEGRDSKSEPSIL